MRKIKIAHIITRFDKGGSAENTFLTVVGLDVEKYDVTLIKGLSLNLKWRGVRPGRWNITLLRLKSAGSKR